MVENTVLSGMKAIVEFCGSIQLPRTEASILQLIRSYKFPARKLLGIWESDKIRITEWRQRYIAGEIEGEILDRMSSKKNRAASGM